MAEPDPRANPALGFDPERLPTLLDALRSDLRAHLPEKEREKRRLAALLIFLSVVLRSPGFRLMVLHRIAFTSRLRMGSLGRLGAALVSGLARVLHGCSIAPTARLHGGLILPHPQGIVIGPDAVVGPRAWIFQNVTIGGSPGRDGLPIIGADARIFPGAVLAGPIKVGRNVVVGANAVVLRDVPECSIVRSPTPEVAPLPERWIVATEPDGEA